MVPGSTFKYGSSFCSLTRNPLFSNNMPIEAEVSPLPSELTTPPVTKMCLLIARRSWRKLTLQRHYIACHAMNNQRRLPGRVKRSSRSAASPLCALLSSCPIPPHELRIIGRSVDSAVCVCHVPHGDCAASAEHAKLFEFFRLLQDVRGRGRNFQEKCAAIGIHTEVLEESRRASGEVWFTVAHHRNR